jgi:hypothetical protein
VDGEGEGLEATRTKRVVHHGVDPTVRVAGRDLEKSKGEKGALSGSSVIRVSSNLRRSGEWRDMCVGLE